MKTVTNINQYEHYCRFTGLCEGSVKRYVAWMNSVASVIGNDITVNVLKNEADIWHYKNDLIKFGKNKKTVSDHVSAMKKYVEMVSVINLINGKAS